MTVLSNRLKAIASFVPQGSAVVDVGTDHAILPIWLAEAGICSRVIATDINTEPLQRAYSNVRASAMSEKIELRLGQGLACVGEEEINVIIVAGMGSDNIGDIILESGWCFSEKRLILQPMTKHPELIGRLWQNGFFVRDEKLAKDAGKIYRILQVEKGISPEPSPADLYAGEALLTNHDPLLREYLHKTVERLERALSGIRHSRVYEEKSALLFQRAIEGLGMMIRLS